jgi:hypothetical protein
VVIICTKGSNMNKISFRTVHLYRLFNILTIHINYHEIEKLVEILHYEPEGRGFYYWWDL